MTRQRRARVFASLMVVILVAGAALASLVVMRRDQGPPDTVTPLVIREGRQFAVASLSYDAAGAVEREAIRVAALTTLTPAALPPIIRGDGPESSGNIAEVERLRALPRSTRLAELQEADAQSARFFDSLVGAGYEPTAALRATLAPLAAEVSIRWQQVDPTPADLQQYETARHELDSLQSATTTARAEMLKSLDALARTPAGQAPDPNWAALAAIGLAVLALEAMLAVALIRIVAAGDTAVVTEVARRRDQVVSMFLVARRLTAGRPGAAITATVAEEAAWTVNADFAVVALVEREQLAPVATFGDVTVSRVASSSGLLGRCADMVQTQNATVPGDPILPNEPGPVTLLAAPVTIRRQVVGVLAAGRRSADPFDADDEMALTLLAHVTGTALEDRPTGSPALAPTSGATVNDHDRHDREAAPTAGPAPHGASIEPIPDPRATSRGAGEVATAAAAAEPIEVFEAPPAPAESTAPAAPPGMVEKVEKDDSADVAETAESIEVEKPVVVDEVEMPVALAATANIVRVLTPDLQVWRNGATRKLPGASARLLAVLVAQRRPITVDKLADLLWPEIDLDAGRNRLNVTVHRLRKALDLPGDELLVRSADGITLIPGTGWIIDSWCFWDQSGAEHDLDTQAGAYDLHRAAFCARQFAYEDAVSLERDRLVARWADLTIRLLGAERIDAARAADRALAFGLNDEEVLRKIADALEAAGHRAQAAALVATIDEGRHLD